MRTHLKNTVLPPLSVVALFILISLFVPVSSAQCSGKLILNVAHARTGELLFSQPVIVEDEIRLSWIHSVELTPWEEYYSVLPTGELLLTRTRFQSYGAGVPEYGGTFRKEKSWMIHENINRVLPALQWIHSHAARFQIDLNNRILLKSTDLPHHEPLKLSIIRELR